MSSNTDEADITLEARVTALERKGLVRRPIRPLDPDFADWHRPEDQTGRGLEIAIEERTEGR